MLFQGTINGRTGTGLRQLGDGLLRHAREVSEKSLYWWGQSMIAAYAGVGFDLDLSLHTSIPGGPKIFAANHPSTTDPFLITRVASEQMCILIDETLFKVPVFGSYLRAVGHVPVIPGQGPAMLDAALRLLEMGRSVVIFPEGQISPLGGGFHRPRSGVARLAIRSGAPVVPVGIHLQSERIRCIETMVEGKPEVGTWYTGGPYAMTAGAPVRFSEDVSNWSYVRSVSKQVMGQIVQLSAESAARMRQGLMSGVPALEHSLEAL